jgi:uncharacterized membrane protein YbhN (UPF0104 family)
MPNMIRSVDNITFLMKTKLRKTYNIFVRLIIFIITIYFLYDEIFRKHDISYLIDKYEDFSENSNFLFYFLFAVFLIPFNLAFETLKWQLLISKLEKISFFKAFKAVLTGISISMFLPNRTGDYLGRVFILQKADRLQAVLSTIIGSVAQLITTLIFGIISVIILFPFYYKLSNNLTFWLYTGLIIIGIIMVFVIVFAYIEFAAFTDILKRITGREYRRIKKYAKVFLWYNTPDLLTVLTISIIRYLIFSFQFFLLLKAFDINSGYFISLMLISMIYLMMTIIPTIALSELGVRSSVSVFVFQSWMLPKGVWTSDTSLGVLLASTTLWLFNIAAPALTGAVFVFDLKFFRKNKGQ